MLNDYLSAEDIRHFTTRSDWAGLRMLVANWAMIIAIFWGVAQWTNPLSALLAILLLGGRQLGLAVLMHEAGHLTLFRTPWMNRVLGQWFAAYPVLGDCLAYARSHREHHKHAGTGNDPDRPNFDQYPVSRASFRRKLTRDISGRTGSRMLHGLLRGVGNLSMMRRGEDSGSLGRGILVNLLMFAALALPGRGELYLLWVAAYLTSYMLVARIRQVAEHGAVDDPFDRDPRKHTRTTIPAWYERLLLCPNNVSFHVEHHLLPSAPAHRLPALHRTLSQRGYYDQHPGAVAHGYLEVIRRAVPAPA